MPGRHLKVTGSIDFKTFVICLYGEPAALGHGVASVDAEVQQRVLELVRIDERGPNLAPAVDLGFAAGFQVIAAGCLDTGSEMIHYDDTLAASAPEFNSVVEFGP